MNLDACPVQLLSKILHKSSTDRKLRILSVSQPGPDIGLVLCHTCGNDLFICMCNRNKVPIRNQSKTWMRWRKHIEHSLGRWTRSSAHWRNTNIMVTILRSLPNTRSIPTTRWWTQRTTARPRTSTTPCRGPRPHITNAPRSLT